jgi:hypothetical protein
MRAPSAMLCAALFCCTSAFADVTSRVNPKERYIKPKGLVIPQDKSTESIELRQALEEDASDQPLQGPGKKIDATTRPPTNRQYVDNPDATDRLKVHIIYAVPYGGIDRAFDLSSAIPNSISSANRWLAAQTKKKFLLDTYGDHLDITYGALPNTEAFYREQGPWAHDTVINDLRHIIKLDENKIWVVYYEGWHHYACADAQWQGKTTVIYMGACGMDASVVAQSPTADPDYHEFVFLHELIHNITGPSLEAPNISPTHGAHVADSRHDVMYAGDEMWEPSVLDYNNDDYYNKKSLPAALVNLADSPLLTKRQKK